MVNCNKQSNKGFTLPEVILVSAVIAIVVTLVISNATDFLSNQQENEERSIMAELEQGIAAYSEDRASLPPLADMAAEFSQYTNLSAEQIADDLWGNEREYRMFSVDIPYRHSDLEIFYGVIYSVGSDQCVGNTIRCYPGATAAQIDNAVNGILDVDGSGAFDRADFEGLEAEGDDLLIKFTDFQSKKRKYDETSKRLKRIGEALKAYSQTRYYEEVAAGVADANQKIYYPPVGLTPQGLYGANVWQDAANVLTPPQETFDNDPADEVARRDSMIELMNLLALPQSYCCSAIEKFEVVDPGTGEITRFDRGFFYYSHPRARRVANPMNPAVDCDAHPATLAGQLAARKLPARITVEEDVCG